MSETLSSNTTLGHYSIVSKIGAGGMGEVYRARDTRLDREVAIKLLPANYARDLDRLRRFESGSTRHLCAQSSEYSHRSRHRHS